MQKIKSYHLFLILPVLIIGAGLIFRKPIGLFVWKSLHVPNAALFFYSDAKLALEIGNYYFNVYGDEIYDLQRADEYFVYALALDPDVPDAWHQRARIDFLNGRLRIALDKINTQMALHGDSLMASYYIRGLIYGYLGKFDLAENDFQKFKVWDPTNWAIYNDLAWIYFQKGDFVEAEKSAREGLIRSNSESPWLLTALGVALLNLERKDEARQTLLKAEERIHALTERDWLKAYPGNNPDFASEGIEAMKKTVTKNLVLLDGKSAK